MTRKFPTEREARAEQRLPLSIATYYIRDAVRADCEIVDLSAGGVQIITEERLADGAVISLALPTAAPIVARVVCRHEQVVRLAFIDADETQRDDIRRLVFSRLG